MLFPFSLLMFHLFFLKDGGKGDMEAREKTEGNNKQVGGGNEAYIENEINVQPVFNLIMIVKVFL